MQTTLKRTIDISGVGLHTGRKVNMRLRPARADVGVVFVRTDVEGPARLLPVRFDAVEQVPLCTKLSNLEGVSVSTIEHIMAALGGLGVDNAIVEVSGPEVPILDGSALPFVEAIDRVGITVLKLPSKTLKILKTVRVQSGSAWAQLSPGAGLTARIEIDFPDAAIGHQVLNYRASAGAFRDELAASRTFCRASDIEGMKERGLALGGTLQNAIVFDGPRIISPGGLRMERECVRHKMLDVIGDLAVLGCRIDGCFRANRPGHALTNRLIRALIAEPGAFSFTCPDFALAE